MKLRVLLKWKTSDGRVSSMRKVKVYHVDAFTTVPFSGNPAGVVPDAAGLTNQEMESIARELNMSETAFLLRGDSDADFRVRYFTPTSEIDFCGHATVGASWLLATEFGWAKQKAQLVFKTNVGIVPVEWTTKENGDVETVFMRQISPRVQHIDLSAEEVARLLGVDVTSLDRNLPIRLGYTGNWHLLVPLASRKAIDEARPLLTELAEVNTRQNAVTTHLFTFDCDPDLYDLYTRDFGPAVGIPEDPITGAANGALAGYLVLEGILDRAQRHKLRIAQGDVMGRPGTVHVDILPGMEPEIRVGGSAVVTIQGELRL